MNGTSLVLPSLNIDKVSEHARFLILSLPNNEMLQKSPFAIHKAIQGISGEPKSVKKLRSGDLLIETSSALQTKSLLLTKTFLDCPLIVNLHRSLNSCRGVISETDLLCASEAEILDGLSDQGVTEIHTADSKLCPKWKTEKEIQTIKTNKNITYFEARKLIAPQFSQTYAQVAKPSIATSTTQTDENITKVKCPPLQILKPLLSVPHPNASPSITSNSTSSSTTQVNLLPSASSIKPTTQTESRLPEPISSAAAPDNSLNTSASSLSTETRLLKTSNKFAALSTEIQSLVPQVHLLPSTSTVATVSEPQPPNPTSNDTPSITNTHQMKTMFTPLPAETCPAVETATSITDTFPFTSQDAKQTLRSRKKRRPKRSITSKIDTQLTPHKPKKYVSSITSSTTSQQLWRKVKAANGLYREFNIPILETSTALFSSPLDVANLIGKTFASVSSSDSYSPAFQATKNRLERTPINFRCRQPLPYNCDFDMFELKRALSSAHNTSPGPDGISYELLRHLKEDSLVSLLYLFNRIWREQVYPTQWQEAIVIPILKPGKDPKNPLSYRPIALTSCLCKTLECVVNAHFVYELEKKKCIPLFQSGFRKGRSTLAIIITLENKIRNAFIRRNHLVSIFFDIEKAYDRTWRYGILRTLFNFGLRGNLPTFTKKILNLRTFRVRLGGTRVRLVAFYPS
ncbi:probable RNA-directed DNA polymerase from transposon X-element [Trichonephila clavipes]|nr:probable RNA-directed DNA polymerase from transposon X-element [Trichonephila clavipes]